MIQIKVLELLGGAYINEKTLHVRKTHAFELDEQGYPVRSLCRKVKPENACDIGPDDGIATCKVCAARLAKIQRERTV
jgi:hypothetical protein